MLVLKAWGRRFNTNIHKKVLAVMKALGTGFNTNIHNNVRFSGACAEGLWWRIQHTGTKESACCVKGLG